MKEDCLNNIYEILVPTKTNRGYIFSLKHHQEWDEKVRAITGGLTIQKTSKGSWLSMKGNLILEEMIPVKMVCEVQQFKEIMSITLEHYNDQELIMGYLISENVFTLSKEELKIEKELASLN